MAIEIIANEPFENEWGKGQFTHKIFHIDGYREQLIVVYLILILLLNLNTRKLPKFVSRLFPASATKLDEKSWNAFPYCKTELTVKVLRRCN